MFKNYILKLICIDLLLLSGSFTAIAQEDMISYYTHLAHGQGKILLGAKPIEGILKRSELSENERKKLNIALHIRRFAFDSLLLYENKNYTRYYDQKGEPLLWVITGSKKYSLTPKTWKFPIVGEVGYKGFFTKEDAEYEAALLQKEGYETRIREVNAWSTLGFLNDPILSSMLNASIGDLANVLIHELSHGTIFIKDDTDESENLASFIGDQGAYLYLETYYGKDSKEYLQYKYDQEDYELLAQNMLLGAQRLDSLYKAIEQENDMQKEAYKQKMIREIVEGLNRLPFHNPDAFKALRNTDKLPNNATFILFRQYNNKSHIYREEFEKLADSDLKKYIEILKKRYG